MWNKRGETLFRVQKLVPTLPIIQFSHWVTSLEAVHHVICSFHLGPQKTLCYFFKTCKQSNLWRYPLTPYIYICMLECHQPAYHGLKLPQTCWVHRVDWLLMSHACHGWALLLFEYQFKKHIAAGEFGARCGHVMSVSLQIRIRSDL